MALLPEAPSLKLGDVTVYAKTVSLRVASTCLSVSCPVCGHETAGSRSRYRRALADQLRDDRSVRLLLQVRESRCSESRRPRRIFAERLASVVEPYARKTACLLEDLRLVGFALGGEGGTRLL